MKIRRTTVVALVFVLSLLYLVYQVLHPPVVGWSPDCTSNDAFIRAIAARASADRYIILALVDSAFVDMAVNLYETSLRPNGIDNFLFVGVGRRTCDELGNVSSSTGGRPLPCHHYTDVEGSEKASVYLSADFLRKMNVRTDMIIDALAAGFTVVHTDLDVVFFKNPLPDLKVIMLDADMAALWDSIAYNAGFVAVRPTSYGRRIYEMTQRITSSSNRIDDQKALNYAVRRLGRRYRRPSRPGSSGNDDALKAVALDTSKYVCGLDYFESAGRWFPTNVSWSRPAGSRSQPRGVSCGSDKCATVVHNNWIVSREAKIYRFKEHLMWMYDKDEYYSSDTRRYLTYDNSMRSSWPTDDAKGNSSPVDDVVFADQIDALRSALAIGRALGRVVILPRFHCNITTPPASAKTSNPRPSGSRGAGPSGGVSWNRRRKPSAEGASPGPVNRTYFECPLNSLLNLAAFDAAFDGAYRENSFLRHPKVPDAVKQSISSPHGVVTTVEATSKSEVSGEGGATVALSSAPLSLMITELTHGELLSRFGHVTDKVLTLGQLYDVRPRLASNDDQTQFDKLAAKAFRRSNYRQL